MGIDVTFIEGSSNAGKSTLVRLLTGMGQKAKSATHPDCSYVAQLCWYAYGRAGDLNTLCLVSSINEYGQKGGYKPGDYRNHDAVSPGDMVDFLDEYYRLSCPGTEGKKIRRAIIPVSSSSGAQTGFGTADYANVVGAGGEFRKSGQASSHKLRSVVAIRDAAASAGGLEKRAIKVGARVARIDPPPSVRNVDARFVRAVVGLL